MRRLVASFKKTQSRPGDISGSLPINKHLPMINSDKPRDECGIFAVYNYEQGVEKRSLNAAQTVSLGLQALQHRGQESAGMTFRKDGQISSYKGMGLVGNCFSWKRLRETESKTVLGHVRYSTTGSSTFNNIQPLIVHSSEGYTLAVAHNGNLSNSAALWQNYLDMGHIFQTESDTEILIAFLFQNRKHGLQEAVTKLMYLAEGAFSVVAMTNDEMVAFRDPRGFRPLCIGRLNNGYVFSSETCALNNIGAEFEREIKPGEIVSVRDDRMSTLQVPPLKPSFCIFEYIYFARPDSDLNGINVHQARKNIGARLATQIKSELDIIVPSPDSGVSAAMGMSEASGIPFDWGIYRNPYGGRTFINPGQESREMAARLKFSPISPLIKGKRVAVVDDSLVRGTTARQLSMMLRKAGAREVHFFIASPPYRHPCYYGIDIPLAVDLACSSEDTDKFANTISCDSLSYNTIEDLYAGIGMDRNNYCSACFDGNYPVKQRC